MYRFIMGKRGFIVNWRRADSGLFQKFHKMIRQGGADYPAAGKAEA
jgi:hypothetical protein